MQVAFRSVRTAAKLALVCAGPVLVAACSSSTKASPPASTTTVSPSVQAASTTTTSVVGPPDGSTVASTVPGPDLARLILVTVASGYAMVPDKVADTGPTDLAKATRDDVNANAPEVLRQTGFLDGYQRLWQSAGGLDDNTILLYRFATPAGAEQFLAHWLDELGATTKDVTPTRFAVLLPAPAYGVRGQYQTSSSAVVVFAKGSYAVQASVQGPPGQDETRVANQLALAQYSRLP